MCKISIYHDRLVEGSLGASDATVLRRFDTVIAEHAVVIFVSTSDYRWEQDPAVKEGNYFRLVKTYGAIEILSQPIEFLRKCTPEEFLELLKEASIEYFWAQKRNEMKASA